MSARKQTVSFTEPAFAYAQALVEAGEYPSISAAVSGEMVRAKAARLTQAASLVAEVERRLALPLGASDDPPEFVIRASGAT